MQPTRPRAAPCFPVALSDVRENTASSSGGSGARLGDAAASGDRRSCDRRGAYSRRLASRARRCQVVSLWTSDFVSASASRDVQQPVSLLLLDISPFIRVCGATPAVPTWLARTSPWDVPGTSADPAASSTPASCRGRRLDVHQCHCRRLTQALDIGAQPVITPKLSYNSNALARLAKKLSVAKLGAIHCSASIA